MTRATTVIERTYRAELQDVWDLWTTKEGIESWWGPEGFTVEVRSLDLRPGGLLRYAMIATAAPQVAFMKKAGMPLTSEVQVTYNEVLPLRRLAYANLVDFVPGVAAYTTATLIELAAHGAEVKMILTLEAMHNDEWTERATMGWKSELEKLEKLITPTDRARL